MKSWIRVAVGHCINIFIFGSIASLPFGLAFLFVFFKIVICSIRIPLVIFGVSG